MLDMLSSIPVTTLVSIALYVLLMAWLGFVFKICRDLSGLLVVFAVGVGGFFFVRAVADDVSWGLLASGAAAAATFLGGLVSLLYDMSLDAFGSKSALWAAWRKALYIDQALGFFVKDKPRTKSELMPRVPRPPRARGYHQ